MIFNILSKPFKIIFKFKGLKIIRKKIYYFIWWSDYIKSEETPFLKETYLNIIWEDISEEIKKINNDTLLIWWELDKYTPVSDAYFMRKSIKKSKLIIIENEKHSIHLKNPKLLVNKFLENI
jgi:pimeloyl-ACP methyl ester carboxylesterase